MLHINDLVYRIAGRVLIDGATAAIPAGHRVGLVGRNGAGKTTLFRLILGEIQPDGGGIRLPKRTRVGAVAQEAPGGDTTPIDSVLSADEERSRLLREAETARDPGRIAEIQTRLFDISAHSAPARAAEILDGLGFDETAQRQPLASFSGGWRMRVALAAQLFRAPDLLLLDEPTNHLDLEATVWLLGFLRSYPGTFLLISHDRDLLNESVDHILHLDQGKLKLWSGGYDRFIEQLTMQRTLQSATAAKIDAQRRHMQSFVDRFRYKASKARQAQSRLKAIAKLANVAAPIDPHPPSIGFPEPAALAPPLISLDDVAVGYAPGRPVLRRLGLRIDPDDRIALLGANGNGKTTLARLIAGRLHGEGGHVHRSPKLSVGFFAQHQLEELEPEETPMQHLGALLPDLRDQELRSRLGRFGFGVDHVGVPTKNLSGGERARLSLCLISRQAPNILILDEPTNHLDIDHRTALIEALGDYGGAVILISHDPHLVRLIADRLWLVADGTVTPFDGDIDDYRAWLSKRGAATAATQRESKPKPRPATAPQAGARPAPALAKAEASSLRRQARDAEKRLAALTAERAAIEAMLADPETYRNGGSPLADLTRRKGHVDREIAEAENAWLDASERLEAAG
jgi:ATP-binding cassette subfamily F protein 3